MGCIRGHCTMQRCWGEEKTAGVAPIVGYFFFCVCQKEMASPPVSIWVKRWELRWEPIPETDELQQLASCTWQQCDVALPALPDWPRWKPGPSQLPLDEYWRLSYALHGCEWQPVWTRIETPRAWRWVASPAPCPCPPLPCSLPPPPCSLPPPPCSLPPPPCPCQAQ